MWDNFEQVIAYLRRHVDISDFWMSTGIDITNQNISSFQSKKNPSVQAKPIIELVN